MQCTHNNFKYSKLFVVCENNPTNNRQFHDRGIYQFCVTMCNIDCENTSIVVKCSFCLFAFRLAVYEWVCQAHCNGVTQLQLVCSLFLWFVSIQTRFIRCRVFYIFLLFWNNRKSSIFSPLQHRHRYQHSIDINSMVNKIIITKRKNWNTEKKEEKTYFSAVKTKHTCQALSFILIVLPFFALLLATSIFIHK